MDILEHHYSYLVSAIDAAAAAPLSAKKALLAILLLDAYVDRLFAGEGDVLAYRDGLAATSPALRLVMEVAARRLQLVTEAVAVPIDEVHRLSEADFMVSVYNDGTVQRVRVALADGGRRDVHEVIAAALAALGPPRG